MAEEHRVSLEGTLPGRRFQRRLLILVFALGSSAIIAQSLLVREFLVVCFGNELSLGVIFASWLLGMATGGAAGGRLARGGRRLRGTLLAGVFAAALVLPLQLTLIRASRALAQVPVGELIPLGRLLALAFFLGAPGSFCLGLTFAPACALLARSKSGTRPDKTGRATSHDGWEGHRRKPFNQAGDRGLKPLALPIGRVYVVEALGALFGGSLFSLVLAGRVQTFPLATAVAAALVGMSAYAVRTRRAGSPLCWAAVLVAVGALGAALPLERWTREVRWESLQPGVELVATVDSRYQNLALGRLEDQYTIYGNGEVMGTFPDPYSASQRAHLFMAEHPAPKRVLLLGGGIEGLVAELLKHPLTRLDYVSLDPAVTDMIRPHLPDYLAAVFSDDRFHPYYSDGRYFVKQTQDVYDLIIVDVPDPQSAMVNRFYTVEFFREVEHILSPGGVLITRAGETYGYIGEEVGQFGGSVYRTLKQVFAQVLATPSGATYLFAAREPGIVSTDPEVLAERYRGSGVESEYFAPELYEQLLPPEWVAFVNDALRKRTDVPINTDARPVTYFYGLVLWDRYSGSHLTPVLRRLERLGVRPVLAVLGVGALLAAGYQVLRRGRRDRHLRLNLTWTVAATGCAAMAAELVLIFAFQNSFGYVYEKVGLIVGVFMFGLAAGGLAATRLVGRRPKQGLHAILAVNAALVVFAVVLPGAIGLLSATGYHAQEAGFGLLVWLAGALTGAHFPLAAHLIRRTGTALARTAGRLDWADHVGACAGALVTGVVLVPVTGLAGSCYLVAGLAGTSLLLLAVSAWSARRA